MEYEWIMALLGGALVGVGGCIFLAVNGSILGTSGILGGLVDGSGRGNWAERISFIAGLIFAPALLISITGMATTTVMGSPVVLIAAGLLTGIGTRLANGCTSGHAISGISRLSLRSTAATLSYVVAGVIAVAVFRHVWGIV